jgi:hypothetical protein
MQKPISAKQHGLIDWGFATALLVLPRLLNVNAKAQKFYTTMGCNVIAINGTTDHGSPIKPLISFKAHEKLDYANMALLYGMFAAKMIHNDNRALGFHIGLTALATANVLLTDYDDK